MEILNRFTYQIIFKDNSKTMKETILNAFSQKISFRCADLSGCKENLTYLDLSGMNFEDSNLFGINLSYSKLKNCSFKRANLSYAYFEESDFLDSDLTETNFECSYLRRANLEKCKMFKANLNFADLFRANLNFADLSEAYLLKTYLEESKTSQTMWNKTVLPVFSKYEIAYKIIKNKLLIEIGSVSQNIKFWDMFFADDYENNSYNLKMTKNKEEFKTLKNHYLSVRLFLQLEEKVK